MSDDLQDAPCERQTRATTFSISYISVFLLHAAYLRTDIQSSQHSRLSPRQASWLFVQDQGQLTADQRALLERIRQTNTDLQELYQLGQDFVQMVKRRQVRRLDGWLGRAHRSSSVELRGFAAGIKRDYAAVKAALSLPWSQGQVEGQITRLKFLKRQMYGRAHFELLRSRVLRRA